MSDEETAREQRRIERERRNALWEKPYTDWTDEEIVGELTESYKAPEVPPCRVCGGELSCQRVGGGEATVWACSGLVDGELQEGRRIADEHYRRSEWEDRSQGGDGRVLELIRRLGDAKQLRQTMLDFADLIERTRCRTWQPPEVAWRLRAALDGDMSPEIRPRETGGTLPSKRRR